MKSFLKWLSQQKTRDDMVADLACDIKRDSGFPKDFKNIDEITRYLNRKGACRGAHEALDEAYHEFGALKVARLYGYYDEAVSHM